MLKLAWEYTLTQWHQDRGKIHVLFYSDEPVENRKIHIGDTLLEVKCERQPLFVSPSIHKEGNPYATIGTKKIQILDKKLLLRLKAKVDSLCHGYMSDAKRELLPSGRMPIFDNRVSWALFYLKKAGLLEGTRRGFYRITQEGLMLYLKTQMKLIQNILNGFQNFKSSYSQKTRRKKRLVQLLHSHLKNHSNMVIKGFVRF